MGLPSGEMQVLHQNDSQHQAAREEYSEGVGLQQS
ncbi:hypothetical protein MAR_028841 [Mya arenaria]|uniref:Uncharacterized protein n=1 Tax=Mya arenaria TaxID=6604 RepID=A0ABY7DER0_MYAAR|nr:hypothetical protein MAR_028841 [Mya arenaria]